MVNIFKVQLHNHTKFSKDSILPFCCILYLCKLENIDYIAITDHDNIAGAIAFREYCKRKKASLNVIIGEEIMTVDGEIIGLYMTRDIPGGLTASETIGLLKEQGAVIYIPHPYDIRRKKTVLKESIICEYVEDIHCIECWNGRNSHTSYGLQQEKIAQKYNIKSVVGADAHTFWEFGKNVMYFPKEPVNANAFINGLDEAIMSKGKIRNIVHFITKIDRLLKIMISGDFNEVRRIIIKKINNRKFRVSKNNR